MDGIQTCLLPFLGGGGGGGGGGAKVALALEGLRLIARAVSRRSERLQYI